MSNGESEEAAGRRTKAIAGAAAAARDWMTFQAAKLDAVGVQAAVRHRGEVVLDLAWGVADVETQAPLTTDHIFRIASHSKTFTATLVAQLVERGDLRFDDTVAMHIPELADSALASVTVRELLGHQGGVIRDGYAADHWQRAHDFPDRARLIDICRGGAAVYERNEYFKYSNIGYGLLGLVIESATGRAYADLGHERIAAPLGLERTAAEYDPPRSAEYATGHTALLFARDARYPIPHVDTRALAPATGWASTARELTAYLAAHRPGDERLLGDGSKRLLTRSESEVPFGRGHRSYGLGFDVREIGDTTLIGHSGGYPGHITRSWLDAEADLAISVLTNAIDGPADALATGAAAIFRLAIDHEETDPPDSAAADGLSGRYANLWGVIDIVRLGGALFALGTREADPAPFAQRIIDDGNGELRYEPAAGYGAVGEPIGVERASDGAVQVVVAGSMSFVPFEDFRRGLHDGETDRWQGRIAL